MGTQITVSGRRRRIPGQDLQAAREILDLPPDSVSLAMAGAAEQQFAQDDGRGREVVRPDGDKPLQHAGGALLQNVAADIGIQ